MALNGFYSGWLAMVDWFFRWALVSFLESACIRSDPKGKSTPKKRSHTDSRRPTSRYDSLSLSLVLSVRLSVSLSIHLSPSLAAPCLPSLCTGFLLARRGVPAGGRCSRTRWTHFRFHLPSRPVFTRFFFLSLSLSLFLLLLRLGLGLLGLGLRSTLFLRCRLFRLGRRFPFGFVSSPRLFAPVARLTQFKSQ